MNWSGGSDSLEKMSLKARVLLRKFFDAVEMKPGIAGFRIDLRKLRDVLLNY
jgi:hypothetical protein